MVVRPKTPRGDGNISESHVLTADSHVVRPKTPRGDGNMERVTADGTIETSRQTQNPERGRKHHIARHTTATLLLHVLRPKTPRGDGNITADDSYVRVTSSQSSDPKPREGTET
ncbi:Uncharacterised protein [Mycobacterium tuberculosis]|nr:Uncharacterised protein [Mycobacterium tuberculosis]